MRWTEKDADVRTIPAGEFWVGTKDIPRPHLVVAARAKDGTVVVSRFAPGEARDMGEQILAFADQLNAENN